MISNSLDKKELDDGYIQQIKEGDGYVLKFNNLPLSSPLKYFKTSGDFSKGTGVINGLSESEAAKSEPNIIIPDGTVEIGASAFIDNNSIQKMIMADTVEKMGESVFKVTDWRNDCVLTYAKLSRNLKVIPAYTFFTSIKLEKVVFPSIVEEIGRYAFAGVPFTKQQHLVLPRTVTKIDDVAFKSYQNSEISSYLKSLTTWARIYSSPQNGNILLSRIDCTRLNIMVSDEETLEFTGKFLTAPNDVPNMKVYVKTEGVKTTIAAANPDWPKERIIVDKDLEQNYMKN